MICCPDSYYPKPKTWLTRHTLLREFNNQSHSKLRNPTVLYSKTKSKCIQGLYKFKSSCFKRFK